jgi:hypothetical protein
MRPMQASMRPVQASTRSAQASNQAFPSLIEPYIREIISYRGKFVSLYNYIVK